MKDVGQTGDGNRFAGQYPIVVSNGSGEQIPPYAVMQIAGATTIGTDRVFTVVKPNGSSTAKYVLNGPTAINQSGYGAATDQYPAIAAYFGAAVVGAEWGPVAASWLLSVNGKGFTILGGAAGGLVHVAAKGGVSAGDDFPLVQFGNFSGLPRPHGTIFGYGEPITFLPPFPRIPLFISAPPIKGKPFAVILADVDSLGIVDAGPVGVVPVTLDFTDFSHTKADCITGDYTKLASATTGPATILWRQRQNTSGGSSLGQQLAWVRLDDAGGTSETEDIRGWSIGIVPKATGSRGQPRTPGVGLAQLYVKPASGAAGVQWEIGFQVQVENHMEGDVADGKPIHLSKSRKDDEGEWIYRIDAEGCKEIPSG